MWVANYQGNSLSELAARRALRLAHFFRRRADSAPTLHLLDPYGLAIDASGNIWVSNSGKNTLTEFIGIATPVKSPLAGPPQTP